MEKNNFSNENKDISTNKQTAKYSILRKMVMIAVMVIVCIFIFNRFFYSGVSSSTVVKSILQDQKVISELSTLIVPYGGIYEEKDDKGKEILAIAYTGTVTYGLNLSEINITADEENKKIIIKIPPVSIQEVYIDPSISMIPEGKFNKTNEYRQKCKDDLYRNHDNNVDMYELANKTAKETLESFLNPIVENIGDGYTLNVE